MQLPTMNDDAYQKIWKPLEQRFGEATLGQYLHAWVMKRGHNVPQKGTYASMLRVMKAAGSAESDVFNVLTALNTEAVNFALLVNPDENLAETKTPYEVAQRLRFLAAWGMRQPSRCYLT